MCVESNSEGTISHSQHILEYRIESSSSPRKTALSFATLHIQETHVGALFSRLITRYQQTATHSDLSDTPTNNIKCESTTEYKNFFA